MNIFSSDLLLTLSETPFHSQRELAGRSGFSLGLVNRSLQELKNEGLLDTAFSLTDQAVSLLDAARPRRAVILAAGYGMRMVPVSSTPKALLEVRGERLIEGLIGRLQEAGAAHPARVGGPQRQLVQALLKRVAGHSTRARIMYSRQSSRWMSWRPSTANSIVRSTGALKRRITTIDSFWNGDTKGCMNRRSQ